MSLAESYRIKQIRFFGRQVPILCQNENGPCPLLAIGNTLLLRSNISIHPDVAEISFSELTQLVVGFLLDSNPPSNDVRINANQQTQLDSVIKLLPRLQYGLDVNVQFNNIRGFEFTEEMAAFDMSGITLLHGWIVDPEDRQTAAVIGGMSYNKLVEKLLDFRSLSVKPTDADLPRVGSGTIVKAGGTTGDVATSRAKSVETLEGCIAQATNKAELVEKKQVKTAEATSDFAVNEAKSVQPLQGSPGQAETDLGGAGEHGDQDSQDVKVGLSKELSVKDPAADSTTGVEVKGGGHAAPSSAAKSDTPSVQAPCTGCPEESIKFATVLKEGQVAEEFFRETASQLTYYGLSRLYQEVRDDQLCVFFRNNHFSTLFKFAGKLYLLVTDLGYARESSVVWEKLDQIDGDTEYVDSDFIRSSRCNPANADTPTQLLTGQHDDQDYMLALALQHGDESTLAQAPGTTSIPVQHQGTPVDDEAVARALHHEERAMLERRRAALEEQGVTTRGDARRGAEADRRVVLERDRRRPTEAARGNRMENGSSCSLQ